LLTDFPGLRDWLALLRDAGSGWLSHNVSRLGAALAFYSLFSLGPLLLIAIAVAGLFFSEDAVRGQLSAQLSHLVGDEGAKGIQNLLAGAGKFSEGLFATAIGVVTVLIAAVTVVVQLKDALNTVWEVDQPASSSISIFARRYTVALAGVAAMGFLLLVSLLITTALSAVGDSFSGYFPEGLFHLISLAISLAVTTALFAMMFKWLPDADIGWHDVWPGAFITAVLFELGRFLIGFYIGKQGLESTYGAAASVVVVLIWVYYSAQIVLFGAELTRAYARHQGLRTTPAQLANKASGDNPQST
jgi:membrane protein